jgi:hypothetical protein
MSFFHESPEIRLDVQIQLRCVVCLLLLIIRSRNVDQNDVIKSPRTYFFFGLLVITNKCKGTNKKSLEILSDSFKSTTF